MATMASKAHNCNDGNSNSTSEWTDILPFENGSHESARICVPEKSIDGNGIDTNSVFDRESFRKRLEDTCSALRSLDKSSVWVEVPMSRASLIEEMTDLGFEFHHAEGKIAKLNLWLRDRIESKVPPFATHHVGVGAVVVNSRNEILCVRELRNNYFPWKVPGGLADLGESIPDAAKREVMEETGIPTDFHSILCFRHAHGLANGRSDVYFLCRLDPIEGVDEMGNAVIPEPRAEESEIEDTQWVPLTTFREMVNGADENSGHPMMKLAMRLYDQGIQIKPEVVKSLVPGRKPSPLYLPVPITTK